MIGGVTRHMLHQQSGAAYLHVNKPLIRKIKIVVVVDDVVVVTLSLRKSFICAINLAQYFKII